MDNPLLTDTNVPPLATQPTSTPASPTHEQPAATSPVDPQFLANQTLTVEPEKKFSLNSSLVMVAVSAVVIVSGAIGVMFYLEWQQKQNVIPLSPTLDSQVFARE